MECEVGIEAAATLHLHMQLHLPGPHPLHLHPPIATVYFIYPNEPFPLYTSLHPSMTSERPATSLLYSRPLKSRCKIDKSGFGVEISAPKFCSKKKED